MSSVYDYDPDTGIPRNPRDTPEPVTGAQETAQREKSTRARYNQLHIRTLLREREPELARAIEFAVRTS